MVARMTKDGSRAHCLIFGALGKPLPLTSTMSYTANCPHLPNGAPTVSPRLY